VGKAAELTVSVPLVSVMVRSAITSAPLMATVSPLLIVADAPAPMATRSEITSALAEASITPPFKVAVAADRSPPVRFTFPLQRQP
jgi:hypothetical protein